MISTLLGALPLLCFGGTTRDSLTDHSFSQSLFRVILALYPSIYAAFVLVIVFNDKRNKDTSIEALWAVSKERFFKQSKNLALYSVLAGLGFLFLFFPGFWFVAQFCFLPIVLVAEPCKLSDGLKRTYTLTRECRVSLFVLIFFHLAIQALILHGATWNVGLLILLPAQFTLFGLLLTYAYIHIRLFHEGAIEEELFNSLNAANE